MKSQDSLSTESAALASILEALRPLEEWQRNFVLRKALQQAGICATSLSTDKAPGAAPHLDARSEEASNGTDRSDHEGVSPKDFLKQKKPTTEFQRVACLAYYLTHNRRQEKFKTRDITKLNDEAAQPSFSNASMTMGNASRANGVLASAGGGFKRLTVNGESLVEALPDQSKVKEVLPRARKPRRRGKGSAQDGQSA